MCFEDFNRAAIIENLYLASRDSLNRHFVNNQTNLFLVHEKWGIVPVW